MSSATTIVDMLVFAAGMAGVPRGVRYLPDAGAELRDGVAEHHGTSILPPLQPSPGRLVMNIWHCSSVMSAANCSPRPGWALLGSA
jgi:hypothetical protein